MLIILRFSRRKLFRNPVHEHFDESSFVNKRCKMRLTKFLIFLPPIVEMKFIYESNIIFIYENNLEKEITRIPFSSQTAHHFLFFHQYL